MSNTEQPQSDDIKAQFRKYFNAVDGHDHEQEIYHQDGLLVSADNCVGLIPDSIDELAKIDLSAMNTTPERIEFRENIEGFGMHVGRKTYNGPFCLMERDGVTHVFKGLYIDKALSICNAHNDEAYLAVNAYSRYDYGVAYMMYIDTQVGYNILVAPFKMSGSLKHPVE